MKIEVDVRARKSEITRVENDMGLFLEKRQYEEERNIMMKGKEEVDEILDKYSHSIV